MLIVGIFHIDQLRVEILTHVDLNKRNSVRFFYYDKFHAYMHTLDDDAEYVMNGLLLLFSCSKHGKRNSQKHNKKQNSSNKIFKHSNIKVIKRYVSYRYESLT